MRLNDLKPGRGAKRVAKRVGRGPGSGLGKTAGRGVKGQKSRSGGYHKVGFEGGQMPLQRRLPKRGFNSRVGATKTELRLDALNAFVGQTVDLDALKNARLVERKMVAVKVILAGELGGAVTVQGLAVSKGARAAIEAAGGSVSE